LGLSAKISFYHSTSKWEKSHLKIKKKTRRAKNFTKGLSYSLKGFFFEKKGIIMGGKKTIK